MKVLLWIALLGALLVSGATHAQAIPDCWPAQVAGTGTLARTATNADGWAVYWQCPNGIGFGAWGAWSELDSNWLAQLASLTSISAAWARTNQGTHPDYSTIYPMYLALKAQAHVPHVPPDNLKVYVLEKTGDTVVMLPTGTIPAGSVCDNTQTVMVAGITYYLVSHAIVTWSSNVRSLAVFAAQCN